MSALRVDIALRHRRLDLDVDFVCDGALAVTGPSGSGKTTLLRAIAGLADPQVGMIEVGGDYWFGDRRILPPEARSVGYQAQDGGIFPHMTASENVSYPLLAERIGARARRSAAIGLLAALGIEATADVSAVRLSGGQRRRVALARALVAERAVYLLDEPFAGLDSRSAELAIDLIGETLSARGRPALIVGHDTERLRRVSSELVGITAGRLVATVQSPVVDVAELDRVVAPRRLRAIGVAPADRGHEPAQAQSPRSTARRRLGSPGGSR